MFAIIPFLFYKVTCGCEVYVMAPLDLFDDNQNPSYKDKFSGWCSNLKNANVDGVMIDVWWGLTEPTAKNYKWDGYVTMFNIMKEKGLKIIPVFSFHKCGGSVGDYVTILLPSFVFSGTNKPNFEDMYGNKDEAYISFAYDNVKIGSDRTPLEMYRDWMAAFKTQFNSLVEDGTIIEIEVGAGPCGELRYPSYRASFNYPGCGMFQCYDSMFKKQFKEDAAAAGHSEWDSPPGDTGDYNVRPYGSSFWSDGWKSEYGKFFLKWYQNQLIDHGSNVLKIARELFPSTRLSCKISGLHWQYSTECHCAEVTAGFYNAGGNDGYSQIISMFKQHNVDVCFTCLEMHEDGSAASNPPALVSQILGITKSYGLHFEGENALERYDWDAYNQIKTWVSQGLSAFTYLRMTDTLMNGGNWDTFKQFVAQMK
ncbi:glycosyl hydrolase [Tritrichomonas foetus]|uniref:Beta-amylase n=1 Tax=Tritrichomonas foetus TaxID=1144522 RepID=A0A1J4KPJ1_9EUKA|nr:glycosyl hydrolase [Tritrichomonas foetus]|eukprot:OHT12824.1 glycosyl hydrolase [Tritrichomonas foetus]